MKKYIIIVSVYDEENTQAYPLGGVFDNHQKAEEYIREHVNEVKSNHWTRDCVDGKDFYKEEFSIGGSFHAEDTSCGESLDIDIHEVPVMSNYFEVCCVSREDVKERGYDPSNLSDDDMQSIASKMDDLIREGVDYWYAVDGACGYWEVPLLEEDEP